MGHRHVGSDGMVYMPYFHSWNQSNHTLAETASSMSLLFGSDPPVFSRRNNNTHAVNNKVKPQQPPRYNDLQTQAEAIAVAESKKVEDERRKEEEEFKMSIAISRREEEERQQRERVKLEQELKQIKTLKEEVTKKLKTN